MSKMKIARIEELESRAAHASVTTNTKAYEDGTITPAHASESVSNPTTVRDFYNPNLAHASEQGADTKRLDWLELNTQWSDPHRRMKVIFPMETVKFTTLRAAIDAALSQRPAK